MLLAVWVAALACGIAAGILCPAPAAVGLAAAAVVLAVWRLGRGRVVIGVGALALAAGIGLASLEIRRGKASRPEPSEGRPVLVRGEVVRGPDMVPVRDEVTPLGADYEGAKETGRENAGDTRKARLLVRARTLDGKDSRARLWVTVSRGMPDVAPGDEVSFTARLLLPRGLANPGLPDAALLARAHGVDLYASLRSAADLARERAGPALAPRRLAFRLRQAMARAIDARLDGPTSAFVRTMVLGERTGVSPRVEDGFRAAGATHALSVSGLHLAVVAALVFGVLRRVASAVPAWALRVNATAVAAALALPAVAMYTLLTGEAVATVRSALMAAVALVAALCNRPFSLAASIAFAALVLLVESPLLLVDVSFQLSFASVIGLGMFAHRLAPRAAGAGQRRARRVLVWLGGSLGASFAASLITAPLVAHHFGEVTPAAPIGNLALVPLVELAVLPCGLGGALLALVHPLAGALPLWLAGAASKAALAIAEGFRRGAPVILVRFPDLLETAAFFAGALFLLLGMAKTAGARRRWFAAAIVACMVAASSLVARDLSRRSSRDLRVTFVDVGQGDAALVEGPGGFVALVDGGGRHDNSFDTGARVLEPLLRSRGIARLDLVVLSHPHPDHLNGLLRILARFEVGTLWTSGDSGRNPLHAELLRLAREHDVATPRPAGVTTDEGLHIAPVHPWLGDVIAAPPGLSTNDASLAIRLAYAGRSLLLAGDIEVDGEAELVARGERGLVIASDVLKVPHHGSRTSSGAELLAAVRPALAVVSVGYRNGFRLPSAVALARYQERAIRLLRTDLHGAVTVTIDPAGRWSATCARGCR